jgi:hypothetical protein
MAELAARFASRPPDLPVDIDVAAALAKRSSPEVDQLFFACLATLALRADCDPVEILAEAAAQAPAGRQWRRRVRPRLDRLRR